MKKQRHRKITQKDTESAAMALIISATKTLAITLTTASLLTVCAAAFLCTTPDPVLGVSAAAYICLSVSCIVGGWAAWLVDRERAELTAALSGGMLVLLLLAVSVATGGIQRPVYTALGYGAAVLVHFLIAKAAKRFLGTKRRKRRIY